MSFDYLPLGDITNNHDGKRKPVKESERKAGPYPYYGASGIVDYVEGYIFDGEYLLLAEDGENLRTRNTPIAFMAGGKFWVNNHVHIVTGNEKAKTRYLMYALQNTEIQPYLTGAVMPKLTQGNMNKIVIPCPPLDVQDEIINVLGKLDEKIAVNHQINQTLEQMAQAIFKSWFVDFDPVRAKMEGRDTGLPAHIADLFPDELVESELGLVPKGWEWSTIGDEVDVVGGGTPSTQKSEFWEDGEYHWTTPKDLSGLPDKVLLNTERKITKKGLDNISSGLLPFDTVLMSSRAPVGYLVLAKIPTAINQGFIAMKCNKRLPPEYVLQWANSVMDDIKQRASGSTFAEISKKTFKPMNIVVPTGDVLAQYSKVVKSIYDQITGLASQAATLAEARDALLPKLLSGEIEVGEVATCKDFLQVQEKKFSNA